MMLFTSVKTFFRRKSPPTPDCSHRNRRLRHEPLEQRQLLSVTPAISIDDVTVDVQEGSMEFIDAFVPSENRLDGPNDLLLGPDGNLYVSSAVTDSVRRYDAETGALLDEFVASGSGGLDLPNDLAFDSEGNLYVASSLTDSVLRYDGTTGAFIDEFVASGSGGLDGPAGLVFDSAGRLYVSSYVTSAVLRYDGTTGAFLDEFVASGSGGLDHPCEMTFGPDGQLYVNSLFTDSILRYDAETGAFVDEFVSSGSGGLDNSRDLAFGSDGMLYVCCGRTGSVLRYDDQTGAFVDEFVAAGSGGLDGPSGLTFDSDGNLLVGSASTDSVLRYDGTSGDFLDTLIESPDVLDGPFGAVFGPDGDLYVNSKYTDSVLRYDGQTGEFKETFVETDSGALDDIVFGPDGNLYVVSSNTVLRYDGDTGEFIDQFVIAPSLEGYGIRDLTFGPDGNLYVCSNVYTVDDSGWALAAGTVLRYDGTTGDFIDEFVAPAWYNDRSGFSSLVFGPDGSLYVAGAGGDSVYRYEGTTGVFIDDFVTSGSGGLDTPNDLTFGPDGNLYVASSTGDLVLRYDGTTGDYIDMVVSAEEEGLNSPETVVFDAAGNLYVASRLSDEVLRFGAAGQAAVTLSIPEASVHPVTVDFTTSDGTATAGEDYTAMSGTITFAPGVTTRTILVPTSQDAIASPSETFYVTLSNPSSNATIADDQGEVTILESFEPVTLFSDSFESGQWNGLWTEDSQNDWFTSTQRATDGNYSAEVDGRATNATLTLANSVDMTAYASAEFTFDWYIESGFDTGEYLALDFSADGSTWNQVAILQGNVDQENTWHSESIDVDSAYLTDTFQVRFRAYVSDSREDANVDNVQLVATSLAAPPSDPPLAEAGGPYSVDEGGSVLLDGSASADSDGTIVAWDWDLDGDGAYETSGATVAFDAGIFGTYTVGLRVTDDSGATGADTATVTVANLAPTADAGGAYSGNEGTSIQLDGTASTDPGNDNLTYAWDLDNDGTYETSGAAPVFTASDEGAYTVGLQVTDSGGLTATDTAIITVANVAPTADAGGPYSAEEGGSVTLDASGSSDPGDDTLSFAWDLDDDGLFDDATGATVVLSDLANGVYPISVQVSDGDGGVATDSTTVTVASETILFSDSFESGQWNGKWVEDWQNDWFTSAQRATDGSCSAEVDGYAGNAALTLAAPLDLTPYGTATLTFDWLIENGFDAGEYLALDVCDGSWHELARLRGNVDTENFWYHETIDLTPYASENFQIRFRAYVSRYNEDANVDNVQIVAGARSVDTALLAIIGADSTKEDASDRLLAPVTVDLALMTMEQNFVD